MKRLLLDTNIYGLITTDKDLHQFHNIFESKKIDNFLRIYGFNIIRKELKKAPQKEIKGVNVRAALLRAYDTLVRKEYECVSDFEQIANEYYFAYQQFGGALPKEVLFNDFLIVACASIKEVEIVVSEDNATLASEMSQKAYLQVNTQRNLTKPNFIRYEKFKELVWEVSLANPIIDGSNKFRIFLCFFNIFPSISFNFWFHNFP